MTPTVMIAYLRWLKKKMGDESFALILDVYKAHTHASVKKEVQKLRIKLIFVPAYGRGIYQPLDRRLFGIIKKRLSSINENDPERNNKERWKEILQDANCWHILDSSS